MANEIAIPGTTIFTIVLNRAFLRAQFLQYFWRRGVKKHWKNNDFVNAIARNVQKPMDFQYCLANL